jgi:isochorismate synthase
MLDTLTFFNKIESQFSSNLPFVAYAKPNSDDVIALLQEDSHLFEVKDFNESGFIFAPFNNKDKTVLFPLEKTKYLLTNRVEFKNFEKPYLNEKNKENQSKYFHLKLVEKGLIAIKEKQFFKVVLSRKEELSFTKYNVFSIFKSLLNIYKTAFVYCWYHPKIGLWLGATPERFLKISGQQFSTMALAGTQTYKGSLEVQWQKKEIEEQQFVTDFLKSSLTPFVDQLKLSDVKTIKAGSLLHLQTDVNALLKQNMKISALIKNLHPTPATCGLPKDNAKAFILENENYNREFYTGFLGELNLKQKSSRNTNRRNVENNAYVTVKNVTNLYVNLRCMQIKDDKALLYIGGGITKDSIPELEWQETINKTKTMKSILE